MNYFSILDHVSKYLHNRRQVLGWSAAMVCACLCLCSCSKRRAVKTVEVIGTVRLESSPWPANGNISFVPIEVASGYPLRPGWALFDLEGKFSAGSFEDGDGLVPGRYAVNIDCWDTANASGTKSSQSCIPEKYRRGFQELTVPAEAEGPIMVEWVIPAK